MCPWELAIHFSFVMNVAQSDKSEAPFGSVMIVMSLSARAVSWKKLPMMMITIDSGDLIQIPTTDLTGIIYHITSLILLFIWIFH